MKGNTFQMVSTKDKYSYTTRKDMFTTSWRTQQNPKREEFNQLIVLAS